MGYADLSRWELTPEESEYPQAVRELASPPEVIRGIGDKGILSEPALAVIGARRATPYGIAVAELAGRVAAECGVTVVSGGAMGCDFAAGMAAHAAGGRTIVVAGTGADVPYPSSSAPVFEAAAQTGAVISLERWGQSPRRYAFPRRNAIVAALCRVLVITEAGQVSGTMSTADAALELGRTLYAIPGSIFSPNSSGTNRLAAEGARIIPDEASLELAISMDFGVARFCTAGERAPMGPVMAALVACPSRPDELAARLNEGGLTLLRTLTDYESRGLVERLPDGRYSPTREFLLGHNQ